MHPGTGRRAGARCRNRGWHLPHAAAHDLGSGRAERDRRHHQDRPAGEEFCVSPRVEQSPALAGLGRPSPADWSGSSSIS